MHQSPDRPAFVIAAGIADAAGVSHAPGALLLEAPSRGGGVIAAGSPAEVGGLAAANSADRFDLPEDVLIPGLVNAHCHLDLTHIGPIPYEPERGFAGWAERVIRGRAQARDSEALRSSVRDGIARSLRGGVVAVGDIAGAMRVEPMEELASSALVGVSYLELFGFGARAAQSLGVAREALGDRGAGLGGARGVRRGISPHAPYTAGLDLYSGAIQLAEANDAPLCTHLAESPEEHEFVAHGRGPLRDLSERLGLWNDDVASDVGRGQHAIAHLAPMLGRRPMLLAHVNDCPDEHIATIARSGSSVVWCPRGHSYFQREVCFGPHRWRRMIEAGINVCLGTDSILNVPASESDRLSTLDEARRLWRDGERDARLLLAMITTRGAAALGLPPARFTFAPGLIQGVVAVRTGRLSASDARDPAGAVMASAGACRLVAHAGRWRDAST